MKVLVTGGAGYIGSHVVQALLEAGHEPVVYDNLSTGHVQAVKEAELVVADIADRERLSTTLAKHQFDGAIHLAAVSLVGESMRNPSRYFNNNIVNGLHLFDSLVSASVPWAVLSSTAAVYGEPKEIPISETHSQQPANPYGESKLALERILGWYEKAYGFRSIALRYFNAAGAHPSGKIGEHHDPETHLIPIVLQVALGQRDAVDIFGSDYATPDGSAVRDYVHVCDLAAAHVAAMERLNGGAPTTTYNLGSEQGYSVLEIVEASRRVSGKEIPVRMAPRRAGDPPILVASADKARVELGWCTHYDLEGIVETAWRWHMIFPHGYR
ncbi:MAG: UDP-glucose 4-epimerase GalE [Bacillota bacterium]